MEVGVGAQIYRAGKGHELEGAPPQGNAEFRFIYQCASPALSALNIKDPGLLQILSTPFYDMNVIV